MIMHDWYHLVVRHSPWRTSSRRIVVVEIMYNKNGVSLGSVSELGTVLIGGGDGIVVAVALASMMMMMVMLVLM